MICPNCHKNKATVDPTFGVIPCKSCQAKQSKFTPSPTVEFTSDSIREQRKAYWQDFIPMHRGGLSKEWLDRYGAKKAYQHGFTKEEIKKAKYVWSDLTYYGDK